MSDLAAALVLTGPTGAGKSALALELAAALNAEIIALDSMTLYRGLDIGTAKPTWAERAQVPHHLLDVLEPWESANVAWWREQALACLADIQARGRVALFVGGTPFYLKALLHGLFASPPTDAAVRATLEADAAAQGGPPLHARLHAVDPASAARLHPNDVQRIVRALEVQQLTGQPLSALQQQWQAAPSAAPACVYVERPRAELVARIDARVLAMLAAGWLDEVRRLEALPQPLSREARVALGYPELRRHLAGELSLADATTLIQTASRQYVKRQMTWFRHLPGCVPVAPTVDAVRAGWAR
jgi:tRNA dimethylallyltransferase